MAIYHFSGTVISRSQGRSAIACAAYRSAERLYDEKYEKTHDYTKKEDVAFSEILLPEGAPEWMKDRGKLWNEVERCERRKDAQLAREFNFALPRELTIEQNIILAKEFVHQEFVSKGMIADLCIHNDRTESGESQPHAHVMLTMREVSRDGFGQKVREWNGKENLLLWRESWSDIANKHLFLLGHDVSIDHRSNVERGIDLEPQYKIGTSVARERMARLEDHQRIARTNGNKILSYPRIALDAMTRQQSTFTHQDIARFVNRHTVDREQFEAVYLKVKACEQLVYLGVDEKGLERFSTKEMLAVESRMLESASFLSEREGHRVTDWMQKLSVSSKVLTEEQGFAFDHLLKPSDLSCVVGYAGTGKSYLLGSVKEAWELQGYRVLGATLSGIAAENLEASSGIESRTLSSRFYYWEKGEEGLTSRDILVIDEAGMIGSRQMAKVLDYAKEANAKVVLVGDPEQLQAIEAGAAFRAITERINYVELTDIRRQREDWQKEATKELATGKTVEALRRYDQHEHLHGFETQALAKQSLVELWNDARLNSPSQTQIMLAYTRKDAQDLNESARLLRHQNSELGAERVFMTERGERHFAENDRIYFLKNDRSLGVMNGTLGTIENINDRQITVRLDQDDRQSYENKENKENINIRLVTIDTNSYNHLEHGYAATIHKGQGVTVDRSYVLTSPYFDRHATYVACTRHRESADIFYSRENFANEKDLFKVLGRERSKDVTLDYGRSAYVDLANRISIERNEINEKFEKTEVMEKIQETQEMQKIQEKAQEIKSPEHSKDPLAELKRFKEEYERKHPDKAQAFKDSLRPHDEKLAKEAERQIQILERAVEKSHMPRTAKKDLERYAAKIAKKPEVMAYLKQNNKELSEKIQGLAKSREIRMERSIGGWSY